MGGGAGWGGEIARLLLLRDPGEEHRRAHLEHADPREGRRETHIQIETAGLLGRRHVEPRR